MVEKRQSGQAWRPDSAADHNAKAETAEDYMRRRRLGLGGNSDRTDAATSWVYAENVSGDNRRKGEVLELFDLLPDALDDDSLDFTGDVPFDDGEAFGILRAAAPVDSRQRLQVAGVAIAWVNVTNENHMHASLEAGAVSLQSRSAGSVKIIWKPEGLGEAECVVLLGAAGSVDWVISFTVDVALPNDRAAYCSPFSVPPGQSVEDIPLLGDEIEGVVRICDPLACKFNEPGDALVGRMGWARYQLPLFPGVCQGGSGGSGSGGSGGLVPEWQVTDLCCPRSPCS